jgi:hypothetical protein
MGDSSPPPSIEYSAANPAFLEQGPDGDRVFVNMMHVSFAPSVDQAAADGVLDQVVLDLGYAGYSLVGRSPFDNSWQVEFDGPILYADVLDLIDEFATYAEVDGLVPEQILETTGMRWDCDPLADSQTSGDDAATLYAAFQKSGFVEAWDLYRTATVDMGASSAVHVAIVDSGFNDGGAVDDFPSDRFIPYRLEVDGWVQDESTYIGDAYHGSAVASVVGAANLQGQNTDGVNGALAGFQSDVMDDDGDPLTPPEGPESIPYEILTFDCGDTSFTERRMSCFILALAEIAKLSSAGEGYRQVVNISMGAPYGGIARYNAAADLDRFEELIEQTANDVLYVFSAGNDGGWMGANYPTKLALDHDNALAVAASQAVSGVIASDERWEDLSGSSALGRYPHTIVAPGEDVPIIDVTGPSYSTQVGTSFAAPLVSSAAALSFYLAPQLTPTEVVALLHDSGDDVSSLWPIPPQHRLYRLNARNLLRRMSRLHGNPLPTSSLTCAYTADEDSDELSAIGLDPAFQQAWLPHDVSTASLGSCLAPVDVVASPDGSRIYVLCEDSLSLVILDADSLDVLKEASLPAGYDLGSGGRMAIDAEEIVAIPMQDGSQVLLALYEGRTDTWMDSYPFEIGLNETYAVDVTAIPRQIQEVWVQGYSVNFEPGYVRQVLLDPRHRDLTTGDQLDLATQFAGAYPPKGLDASHDGLRIYGVFGDDDTNPEQIEIEVGGSWRGDTCGSIQGQPIERPFDIAVDPQGSGYAYLAEWQTGMVAQINLGSMDCEALLDPYEVSGLPERVAMTPDGGMVLGSFPDLNMLVVFPHDPAYNDWYNLPTEWEVGVGGSAPLGVDSRPSLSITGPRPETRVDGMTRFEVVVRDPAISEVQMVMYDVNDAAVASGTYTRWSDADGVISDFVANLNGVAKPARIEVTATYSPVGYPDWDFVTEAWYR